jgi:iron(III) transport system ATP-binding protein
MAAITVHGLAKRFGAVTALQSLDIEIRAGEFFTLLGPSGCGKTTLLRIVAGFERQNEGDLLIGGRVANDVPAHQRDMGMVFQNYAIFPHMSVFDNVAYGLRQRKVSKRDIQPGRRRPWPWSVSTATVAAFPTSSPAARSSAWSWPGPSSSSPRCS